MWTFKGNKIFTLRKQEGTSQLVNKYSSLWKQIWKIFIEKENFWCVCRKQERTRYIEKHCKFIKATRLFILFKKQPSSLYNIIGQKVGNINLSAISVSGSMLGTLWNLAHIIFIAILDALVQTREVGLSVSKTCKGPRGSQFMSTFRACILKAHFGASPWKYLIWS